MLLSDWLRLGLRNDTDFQTIRKPLVTLIRADLVER